MMINPKAKKKNILKNNPIKVQPEKKMLFNYQIDKQIGDGVSSKVYSAVCINNGQKLAIKKIKHFLQNKHQSLRIIRQILLLRQLKHPNIIDLKQILIEEEDPKKLSLILQYLPLDIKKIYRSNRTLNIENIKRIIYQILLGLSYCQQSQVLHRDLKPQNVLVTQDLSTVKLCDFGLARAVQLEIEKQELEHYQMKSEQYQQIKHANQHMQSITNKNVKLTAHVSTRWYRAPQLIILQRKYSNAIDIWSVGCILGELMTMTQQFTERKPLFPGKACYPLSPPKTPDINYKKINDFPHFVHDQLSVIFNIIGTPNQMDLQFISDERAKNYIKSFGYKERTPFKSLFKFISPDIEDFLLNSLEFNPNKRMTINKALNHKIFDDIRQDYSKNISIKGEPIYMDLQGIEIQDMAQIVLKEYKYYQQIRPKNQLIAEQLEMQ